MTILSRLLQIASRVRGLFGQKRADVEFGSEMQTHLQLLEERFVQQGLSRENAAFAACRQFGNLTLLEERHREARTLPFLATWVQDIRYGLRMLGKNPGFTATAVLTLALGIGANAAIFTLVNAVLLDKLPVADPKTLLRLGNHSDCCVGSGMRDSGEYSLFSTDAYLQLKKKATDFEELSAMQAGFAYRPIVVRRSGTQEAARSVMGEFVSGNYFRTFGLRPRLGRLFAAGDEVRGGAAVAVMSYATWKNSYGGDSSILGSTFFVNTRPVTIAGVAPEGFFGDRLTSTPPELYLPVNAMPTLANVGYVDDPNVNWLYIMGRLKPGVSPKQIQGKLDGLLRQALAPISRYSSVQNKAKLPKAHIVLTPAGAGIQRMQETYGSRLRLLMWISGTVLLIACANIANLLLARGIGRKTEMSIRTALGAKRGRIIRQLLTESILLASLSGMAGLAVAYAGTCMLLALAFPGAESVPIHASPSLSVLAFAGGLSLLTGILFGVAPAWIAARSEPVEALRSGTRATSGTASLLQRGLVVLQAALSLILLVGAGLFSKSLNRLEGTDLKLEAKNRYIVHINPQAAGYSQTQVGDLYRTIEQRFHALPGVERVGISSYTPMEDNNNGWSIVVQGQPDRNLGSSVVKANAEYFDSVGTRVRMGRGIGLQDTATTRTVAVVNQSFVKQMFQPNENPIGQHFGGGLNSAGDYQIVGVVDDTAYSDARWKNHAMFFFPMLQRPASDKAPIQSDEMMYAGAIVLKVAQQTKHMESLTRATLSGINPNLSVVKFQTFSAQIADRFTEDRLLERLTKLFGMLALLLATIGVYGVTAYNVARRTGEIGIRMALGAERSAVTAMVMRGAVTYAAWGLAIGVPTALLCVRFVESQLYEVKGNDWSVLVKSVLTLAATAFLAGLIPARRAAFIEPAQALRAE